MWFTEKSANIGTSFKIKRKLFHKKTKFQKIEVYETEGYGNMLVLDGLIQTVEKLGFFYHEFLVHPVMTSIKNPRKVLIIGGGDGGTAKEVLKYKTVEEVIICEVDKYIIEIAKKYLKKINKDVFDDERVKVKIKDAISFQSPYKFDVVIVDISDPIGPSSKLYSLNFFNKLKQFMNKRSILSAQTESPLINLNSFRKMRSIITKTFLYSRTIISIEPSYPGGFWTYTLGSDIQIKKRNDERVNTKLFDPDEYEYIYKVFRRLIK